VPGDGNGKLYYYESDGSTSSDLKFKRASLYADVGCMPGEAKFDDIDGDGDMDVVAAIYDTRVTKDLNLASTSASIFVYENTAPRCGDGNIDAGEQCETNADCASYGDLWTCNQCQCQEPPTLIELASFEAQGAWGRTILRWETASETDNAGFNVYRSETAEGEFVRINAVIIPAKGSATEGASYKFVDWKAQRDKTYYYKLEDVDLAGNTTFHGPVNAKPWFILGFFK
jgi:hypothetical protein